MMTNKEFNEMRERVGRRYDGFAFDSPEDWARSFRFWAWFPRR